ncbi:tetratricopeptide repeat-containing sensor histidine kinase [Fulvivirgaceae bacterium BMA10]|uniref:histidine kinase n=1 Tax=Splendidivirga corallicola TaxID=3051826 RepID=A0ABT8KQ96_9BACT|nr:tetratricopeptide repeat-containing sensor histidine kinase [Fulvivirgaceae bacterium BMA10]
MCINHTAFPQDEEKLITLETRLILVKDHEKPHILNLLAEGYLHIDYDRAWKWAERAENLARALNNKREEAIALRNKGRINQVWGADYENALSYCFQALNITDSMQFDMEKAETIMAIAHIYEEASDQFQALNFYKEALILWEKTGYAAPVIKTQNKIGQLYLNLNNNEQALIYLQNSLNGAEEVKNDTLKASALYSMGIYYNKMGSHTKALDELKLSLELRRKIEDKDGIVESLNLLGKIRSSLNQLHQALIMHKEAKQISEILKDTLKLSRTANYLGMVYLQLGNNEKSLSELKLGLDCAISTNDRRQILNSYDYLYTFYAINADYKKALEYKDLYAEMIQFISNEEDNRELEGERAKYNVAQKESEIAFLKKTQELRESELHNEQVFRNFLIVSLLLTFVILGLLYYNFKSKKDLNEKLADVNQQINRQNAELNRLNTTKDKFFSIIAHDLKGPINSLSSFSDLLINHNSHISQDEIKTMATDLTSSVKNLSTLLENLLNWARSQTKGIQYTLESISLLKIFETNKELFETSTKSKNIDIRIHLDQDIEIMADKNAIDAVIRNLVSNAVKFTHPGGEIILEGNEWKDSIEINVRDNGIGIRRDQLDKLFKIEHKNSTKGTYDESGTGLGLILCKEFIDYHQGKITVESEIGKGSTFRITLPKH